MDDVFAKLSYMWTEERDDWVVIKIMDGEKFIFYKIRNDAKEIVLTSTGDVIVALAERLIAEGIKIREESID